MTVVHNDVETRGDGEDRARGGDTRGDGDGNGDARGDGDSNAADAFIRKCLFGDLDIPRGDEDWIQALPDYESEYEEDDEKKCEDDDEKKCEDDEKKCEDDDEKKCEDVPLVPAKRRCWLPWANCYYKHKQ